MSSTLPSFSPDLPRASLPIQLSRCSTSILMLHPSPGSDVRAAYHGARRAAGPKPARARLAQAAGVATTLLRTWVSGSSIAGRRYACGQRRCIIAGRLAGELRLTGDSGGYRAQRGGCAGRWIREFTPTRDWLLRMDATEAGAGPVHELGSLRMRSFRAGSVHVIELAEEFDVAAAPGVEHELARVEASDARTVVIDLRRLAFIGSSGLRIIVLAHRRLAERLVVVKGPPRVQRVFELCDLEA